MNKITEDLQNEVQWELENNILPFWMNRMIDNEYGGFHGKSRETANESYMPLKAPS